MGASKIEWLGGGYTWNPITGCSPVSEGCAHCYAGRMATRLRGRYGYPADDPFRVTFHPERMEEPLHWRKPSLVFVCSMGDLFHSSVQVETQDRVFRVMAQSPEHQFIVLTKRPGTMAQYVRHLVERGWTWPFGNVILGVSVENQRTADDRIPLLASMPAHRRLVSAEPLLGRLDLLPWLLDLDWIIVGAETGPGARRMELDWARSIHQDCIDTETPFFFKRDSDESRLLDGRLWEEWPKP